MKTHWAVTVVAVLSVLVVGPALASSVTLSGAGGLALQVVAGTPIMKTPAGAGVTGEVLVSPSVELSPGLTTTFFLDGAARLASSYSRPELRVNTARLADGLHELRMDVSDGTQLVMSTGGVPLHVMNDIAAAALRQVTSPDRDTNINKVYRKLLLREIVWFDEREADLEKHAFRSHGQIYITLTDLIRHIGGGIVWGPDASYIMVQRGGTKVRVFAGSARVLVDGRARALAGPAIRIENRTFVPVRSMLALFGVSSQWNAGNGRLYVEVR
jgi:hypothetical protein